MKMVNGYLNQIRESEQNGVIEQTAIQAGNGGFNINVGGNTHLKGAIIDSTLAAQVQGNNSLTTGTLSTENIENKGEYKASNTTVGYSTSLNLGPNAQNTNNQNPNSPKDQQPAGSTAGSLPKGGLPKGGLSGIAVATSGEASGTTYSAVAPATITITDNAQQQALTGQDAQTTIANLNRDTQHANGSISNPFNQQKVAEQLEFLQLAGELILQPVAAQAAKWIGDTFKPDPKDPTKIDPATFITNHFGLSAQTIADIYKQRWQVELFFKWIKQNLKIKSFLGVSKNAVMTQIWIAMCIYLLLAFIKFSSKATASMQQILRLLSLNLFAKRDLLALIKLEPPPVQTLFVQGVLC